MNLPSDFDEKARIGLAALAHCGALAAEVVKQTDAFFARNGGLERTPIAEGFIIGLYIDHLNTAADSQSAAQPETQKVA